MIDTQELPEIRTTSDFRSNVATSKYTKEREAPPQSYTKTLRTDLTGLVLRTRNASNTTAVSSKIYLVGGMIMGGNEKALHMTLSTLLMDGSKTEVVF